MFRLHDASSVSVSHRLGLAALVLAGHGAALTEPSGPETMPEVSVTVVRVALLASIATPQEKALPRVRPPRVASPVHAPVTPNREMPATTTLPDAPAASAPPQESVQRPADKPYAEDQAASDSAYVPPRFEADYLENPPPGYPLVSRRLGEQGRVVLSVRVNPLGRPERIELAKSSGHLHLDRAAREAVSGWRFVPAHRRGEAVAAWVQVPLVFRLKREGG
jgi:protein TonB